MNTDYTYVNSYEYTDREIAALSALKTIADSLKTESPAELEDLIGTYVPDFNANVQDLSTNKVTAYLIQSYAAATEEDETLELFREDVEDYLAPVVNSKLTEIAYVVPDAIQYQDFDGYVYAGGSGDSDSSGGGKNSGNQSNEPNWDNPTDYEGSDSGGKGSGGSESSGGGKNSGQQDQNNGGGKNSGGSDSGSGGGKGSGDDVFGGNCDCDTACNGYNVYAFCYNECLCAGALEPEDGWEDEWGQGGAWSFETSTIGQILGGIGSTLQNAAQEIGWGNIFNSFKNTDDNGNSPDADDDGDGIPNSDEIDWGNLVLIGGVSLVVIIGGIFLYRKYKK